MSGCERAERYNHIAMFQRFKTEITTILYYSNLEPKVSGCGLVKR